MNDRRPSIFLASPSAPAYRRRAARLGTLAVTLAAAAFVAFYQPPRALARAPFATFDSLGAPRAVIDSSALGRSGAVRLRFAMPGGRVANPVELRGDTSNVRYLWSRLTDSIPVEIARTFSSDSLVAPSTPGFYRLSVVRLGVRRFVDGVTLAVLVPFDWKKGALLDGYRIGTYLAERRPDRGAEHPEGFVRVDEDDLTLPISDHLMLADFLTRDGQDRWPRYAAVDPRVLDKLELVVERVRAWRLARGGSSQVELMVSVHSAYRTPFYNRTVRRAARDSRHQYGDAVDIALDANGDGRLNAADTKIVAAAADSVEAQYPDLAGGVGIYTSGRYRHPYVHIDARGTKVRWRG